MTTIANALSEAPMRNTNVENVCNESDSPTDTYSTNKTKPVAIDSVASKSCQPSGTDRHSIHASEERNTDSESTDNGDSDQVKYNSRQPSTACIEASEVDGQEFVLDWLAKTGRSWHEDVLSNVDAGLNNETQAIDRDCGTTTNRTVGAEGESVRVSQSDLTQDEYADLFLGIGSWSEGPYMDFRAHGHYDGWTRTL